MSSTLWTWMPALLQAAADHLWGSTLVAGVVWLLALAFRHHRAQVRYALWLAASAKFLLPFAALVGLGSAVGSLLPAASAPAVIPFVVAMDAMGDALVQPGSAAAAGSTLPRVAGLPSILPLALLVVWAAGAAFVLAVWLARWRRVAALVRASARVESGREWTMLRRVERAAGRRGSIELAISDAPLEPGVFGIHRPVLLWPRRISQRLDDEQMAAILAHELAHVRRRDNLAAAVHMAVQALFWFYPVVWWIGARLVDERERACDEEAIRQSRDPRVYAEGLLATCRMSIKSPLACVAGVSGSNLKRRIEAIMQGGATARLTRWRKGTLAAAGALALIAPVAIGVVTAPRLAAETQAPAGDPAKTSAFEVASIRPNDSGTNQVRIGIQPGGRFNATNVTLQMLIRNAYQLQPFQIVGGPDWIDSARFDIAAKAEGDPAPTPPGAVGPIQLMLRSLLEERFRLAVHSETREMPIYSLVRARSDGRLGPQLRESTTDCRALMGAARGGGAPPAPPAPGQRPTCGMRIGIGMLSAGGFPAAELARALSPLVQRIVVDRTGLDGNIEADLSWTPDPSQLPQGPTPGGAPPPAVNPDGPSLFTALEEQLGLKLEPGRGPVDVLVIDSAERPTPD